MCKQEVIGKLIKPCDYEKKSVKQLGLTTIVESEDDDTNFAYLLL